MKEGGRERESICLARSTDLMVNFEENIGVVVIGWVKVIVADISKSF